MAPAIQWKIYKYAFTGSVNLGLALRQSVSARDYVICIENVDVDAFIEANPAWNYSARLQKPFMYTTALDVAPGVMEVGTIILPPKSADISLLVQNWRPGAVPASEAFDAALVKPIGGGTPDKIHIVDGRIKGAAE